MNRLPAGTHSKLLNLGCGAHYHPAWVNVDGSQTGPDVIVHDLRKPLPFGSESFEVVYHSHVLEHLRRAEAEPFLRECGRVLRTGGILRVVVPDLETIARLYLQNLKGALDGDREATARYDWIILELLDQLVREESGGDMLRYWHQTPMPAEEFVFARMGQEVRRVIDRLRASEAGPPERAAPDPNFTRSGELHRWMYDRFSLGRLMRNAGFVDVAARAAGDSEIEHFARYGLDVDPNGATRKPDSLFMEGRKPRS